MKIKEFHEPVKPDTYEASMALNQLLKIGNHAVKLHKLIKDEAEMEAWVQKKIDLAGDYVKKVHGYMGGEKAGLYDSKMFETYVRVKKDAEGEISQFAGRLGRVVDQDDDGDYLVSWGDNEGEDWIEKKNLEFLPDDAYWNPDDEDYYKKGSKGDRYINDPDTAGEVPTLDPEFEEDAGEGHMSKSTLYHTAKYAIELASMINPGDDLEGWVQSKLNKAADYLQGAYNYEEYQKLNPYREELDSNTLNKHAQVVQKHIDEILARETKLDDIDTKPGMMRILSKRVNEVEKEMAKENRKETNEKAPPGREDQVKALKKKFKDKSAPYAIAWAQHNKHGKPKNEAELEEGLKDWAKKLAAAGVIVGAVAGMGSINNAIDNSVPAVKAMNTALEMAVDAGNDELADMIKKDISAVKIRLDSGRDLNFVKDMQNKYSKFMTTEGLAYESKLAILLNQRIK